MVLLCPLIFRFRLLFLHDPRRCQVLAQHVDPLVHVMELMLDLLLLLDDLSDASLDLVKRQVDLLLLLAHVLRNVLDLNVKLGGGRGLWRSKLT